MRGELTVVAPLAAGAEPKVRCELRRIAARPCPAPGAGEPAQAPSCPICAIPGLHFLRWVLLPAVTADGATGERFDESLVLWTVFDGSLDDHLRTLSEGPVRDDLDAVLACCRRYASPSSPGLRADFLRDHRVAGTAFFDGLPGWSRETVEAEVRLRQQVEAMLENCDFTTQDPVHVWLRVRAGVHADPALAPIVDRPLARQLEPAPASTTVVHRLLGAAIDWVLRTWAPRDQEHPPDETRFQEANALLGRSEEERAGGVNRASILADVKPHWTHSTILAFVLWLLRTVDLPHNRDGRLSTIGTIHAAEWLRTDAGRRLLFLTNYDGPWDGYLNDFSTRAATRLNLIWGNTVGYPPMAGLERGGAKDRHAFVTAVRTHQIPTQVWHSPLSRDLTMQRIRANARIRDGLAGWLTPEQVDAWLGLFGSVRGA